MDRASLRAQTFLLRFRKSDRVGDPLRIGRIGGQRSERDRLLYTARKVLDPQFVIPARSVDSIREPFAIGRKTAAWLWTQGFELSPVCRAGWRLGLRREPVRDNGGRENGDEKS